MLRQIVVARSAWADKDQIATIERELLGDEAAGD